MKLIQRNSTEKGEGTKTANNAQTVQLSFYSIQEKANGEGVEINISF